MVMAKINYQNEPVDLAFSRNRADNSISLHLRTPDGAVLCNATACLAPQYTPPEDCIIVRNYSENAGMLLWLHSAGIIADALPVTTIDSGFVEFPVCKLSDWSLAVAWAQSDADEATAHPELQREEAASNPPKE